MPDDGTFERRNKPTPHGGAYSVAYYLDGNGNPTPKSKAVKVTIEEYDKKGNSIWRTYGTIGKAAA